MNRRAFLLFLMCASLMVVGCSSTPSDEVIKAAITEFLKYEVPISWSGLMGGKAQIEFIELQQVGRFNEQYRYWPVKARVKGHCQVNMLIGTKTIPLDRVGEFQLYEDDYGDWKARINTMQ